MHEDKLVSKSTDLQTFIFCGQEVRGSVIVPVTMKAQPLSAQIENKPSL